MVRKEENKHGYEKPRNLADGYTEVDAVGYDSHAELRHEKTYSDVLVVNAGGIFDFFQHPLKTASLVRQMGEQDILKEISSACHAAGIKVIVRVDFRGVTDEVYKKCPADWFGKQEDGSPLLTKNTVIPLVAPCYNSYYRNEYAIEFINYLLSNYTIDGIWHNALLSDPICYCDRCKESYMQATGKELPKESSVANRFKSYWQWKSVSANMNISTLA